MILSENDFKNFIGRPMLVHSDLMMASFVFRPQGRERNQFLQGHLDFVSQLGPQVFVPTFNYQFPAQKKADLRTQTCEVGGLGQFVLDSNLGSRSLDPMFSAWSEKSWGTRPNYPNLTAFDHSSIFAHVANNKGCIFFYGAQLETFTFVHYVERMVDPVYRYDKIFSGTMVDLTGEEHPINYCYHVRPKNFSLVYDWVVIRKILEQAQAIQTFRSGVRIVAEIIDANLALSALTAAMKKDPVVLVDQNSKNWIQPKLDQLGRRFLQSDFE